MSLVHEPLIELLNRRFVNCYYNAFSGAGADSKASQFAKEVQANGESLQYGAIFTSDGEFICSFGFDPLEFIHKIKTALREYRFYDFFSKEELQIVHTANANPNDFAAQWAHAELLGNLLRFEEAHAILNRVLDTDPNPEIQARTLYLRGHLYLNDWENPAPDKVREAFDAMPLVPKDLADDRAVDVFALDVELDRSPGFYRGWKFRDGVYLPSRRWALERQIRAYPQSNRIGQMHFYLGLIHAGMGDLDAANQVWAKHVENWPEDRWAMLSRIHHTSYQFSPHRLNATMNGCIMVIQSKDGIEANNLLKKDSKGMPHIVINGKTLEGEEAENALKEALEKIGKLPKKDG